MSDARKIPEQDGIDLVCRDAPLMQLGDDASSGSNMIDFGEHELIYPWGVA